ncbi:DNA-binding transcriptional MocR family regulator [Sphingomonas sp. UYAg733]
MNSGATSERVYDALKRRICEREFRPGDRLDPSMLGDTLNSSVTPIRDALHKLTGEGLVEVRPSDGFHLPQIDVPGLQDLYRWTAEILALAIKSSTQPIVGGVSSTRIGGVTIALADATAALFADIAQRSRNIEHRRAISSANDRLHAARVAETKILDGIADELANLREAVAAANRNDVRRQVAAYHRRRQQAAAEVVRILYRNGGTR